MGVLVEAVDNTVRAMKTGRMLDEINGLHDSLAEWQEYAKKLEKKVKFYKSEAIKGWAGYKVAKQIMEREIGKAPTEFEEFYPKVKEQQKKQKEFYEKQ